MVREAEGVGLVQPGRDFRRDLSATFQYLQGDHDQGRFYMEKCVWMKKWTEIKTMEALTHYKDFFSLL